MKDEKGKKRIIIKGECNLPPDATRSPLPLSSFRLHPSSFFSVLLLLAGCILSIKSSAIASASANVPLGHWSYDMIDRLAGRGLIDSLMAGTKPFSRLEMARLVGEAMANRKRAGGDEIVRDMLSRLEHEFKDELAVLGMLDGNRAEVFLKPAENLYFKHIYGDRNFDLENRQGDVFSPHSNYRLGFSSRAGAGEHLAFFIHPELRYQEFSKDEDPNGREWDAKTEVIEGYGKLEAMNLELEAGRDSLWWGPEAHGSILLSDNAEPFDMLKLSNPQPVLLPWCFKYLGPFKFVSFLAELEKDRDIPNTKLWGLRFDFKPHPLLDIGLSRTMMFGGKGREHYSAGDYWTMFWGRDHYGSGKLDTDHKAGFDISLRIPDIDKVLPLARSLTLYSDGAGEDMAGILPSKWGWVWGIYLADLFLTGRTDLRVEYADNYTLKYPELWYRHATYTSGYTYEGRIIGHHMGTDARDLFVNLTQYLTPDLWLELNLDWEKRELSWAAPETRNYGELELNSFLGNNILLKTVYRYERIDNYQFASGNTRHNNVVGLEITYNF